MMFSDALGNSLVFLQVKLKTIHLQSKRLTFLVNREHN